MDGWVFTQYQGLLSTMLDIKVNMGNIVILPAKQELIYKNKNRQEEFEWIVQIAGTWRKDIYDMCWWCKPVEQDRIVIY